MSAESGKRKAESGNARLRVSAEGRELIKHFEGLYLKAYLCPGKAWTIGYGHTGLRHNDGTVTAGRKITRATADKLLEHDLQQFEARVRDLVTVPLQQHEFDALVSFDFNTGALGKSTLLKKVNEGDPNGAALEFLRWCYAGGKRLAGLARRRNAERSHFSGGDWRNFT